MNELEVALKKAEKLNLYFVNNKPALSHLLTTLNIEHYDKGHYFAVRCPECLKIHGGNINPQNNYCRGGIYCQDLRNPERGVFWMCYVDKMHTRGTGRHHSLVGYIKQYCGHSWYGETVEMIGKIVGFDFGDEMPSNTPECPEIASKPIPDPEPTQPNKTPETPVLDDFSRTQIIGMVRGQLWQFDYAKSSLEDVPEDELRRVARMPSVSKKQGVDILTKWNISFEEVPF